MLDADSGRRHRCALYLGKREFLRTLRLRDFYNYEAMLFA
jgi:hypothetical protein